MLPLIYFVSTDFPTLNILYKCTQTICSLLCLAFHLTWRWMNVFSKFIHVKHELVLHSGCSVTESCPTLCNPMDCSTPGFLVLHYLLEFAQTHVHWVDDAIQPSHPLSPSSPALNPSQHGQIFHCMFIPHFIYSQVHGHLGYFYLLAIMNNAAMNICAQMFSFLMSTYLGAE